MNDHINKKGLQLYFLRPYNNVFQVAREIARWGLKFPICKSLRLDNSNEDVRSAWWLEAQAHTWKESTTSSLGYFHCL